MLPETDVARVKRWVAARNDDLPPRPDDVVRIELDIDPRALTAYECRPPWREDFGPEWSRTPIARFRYTQSRREWALYWADRHSRFHRYERVDPTPNVETLLAEVDADPTGIFWG